MNKKNLYLILCSLIALCVTQTAFPSKAARQEWKAAERLAGRPPAKGAARAHFEAVKARSKTGKPFLPPRPLIDPSLTSQVPTMGPSEDQIVPYAAFRDHTPPPHFQVHQPLLWQEDENPLHLSYSDGVPRAEDLSPGEAQAFFARRRRMRIAKWAGGGLAIGGLLAGAAVAAWQITDLQKPNTSLNTQLTAFDPAHYDAEQTATNTLVTNLTKAVTDTTPAMTTIQGQAQGFAGAAAGSATLAGTSATAAAAAAATTPATAASVALATSSSNIAQAQASSAATSAKSAADSLASLQTLVSGITAQGAAAKHSAQATLDEVAPLLTRLEGIKTAAEKAQTDATTAQLNINAQLKIVTDTVDATQASSTAATASALLASKHAANANWIAWRPLGTAVTKTTVGLPYPGAYTPPAGL